MVFYGSQWGTQSTNANGDVVLSGDPSGQAPYQQELYRGLGTGGELWSGVMTQYCDGVATGAQSCPASNTQHVAYPSGGVLAGVWVDESTASPNQATGHQLGVEAVNAAAHFGNTTAASNRDAQYIIVSPHGTHPDGYNTPSGQFCAWHDWNGDTTLSGGAVSSPYGDIAFTNSPYITDMGASCGQDFVNSNGTLDGVSIVNGHEYAETITDQNPPGGWTDSSGAENGDKCAWITPGTAGGSFDLSTAHGTFAMQTTWANDGNGGAGTCEASHAIVTNPGGNTVTVTNPGNQTGTVGTAVSLQIHATDSASGQTLTYSATGLPAGLSINSATGLISGTPTTAGTSSVTVTAKDTTNASGSASFTWTINASGGCTAAQLLRNPTGIILALAAPALGMKLNFPDESAQARGTMGYASYATMARGFGPGFDAPVIVAAALPSPGASTARLADAVADTPGVASVTPMVRSADGKAAMMIAYPTTGEQDTATNALVNRLNNDVIPDATAGTGIRAYLTGPNAGGVAFATLVGQRLPWLIAVVVLVSMVLLTVMFRSVTIAVKAAVMNLLSIGAAYGVLVLITQDGWLHQAFGFPETVPVAPWVPMFLFVILFGLSMDYEVFLLSRIRESYDATGDNAASVAHGLARTARVITAAAAIMVVVFMANVLGPNVPVKQIGLGLAVAVLIDATLVRMVLVPGVMELLGKANWWLPGPLARVLPKTSLAEDEPLAADPVLTRSAG